MPRPVLVFDTECYKNYFLLMFRNINTGNVVYFEQSATSDLDREKIRKILGKYRVVGFNSIHYDLPLLFLALVKPDPATLKQASDDIIVTGLKYWKIESRYGFKVATNRDHIDLIEVAPGKASLKSYGGRIHTRKLQDLPIDPAAEVSEEQQAQLREYCANDLKITEELYRTLLPQIELREKMSVEYGVNLLSKSDAQIAEAVIGSRIKTMHGTTVEKPYIEPGTTFRYNPPTFLQFSHTPLRGVYDLMCRTSFTVIDNGKTVSDPDLGKQKVTFGAVTYKLGIGGLHSTEESVSNAASDDWLIIDRDVISYYPQIILNSDLYPLHIGKDFLSVYKAILEQRLTAKRDGDKVTADSLKITVNGSFGKFGSKYSILYSPHLLVQTTLTGQLSLLMLIEQLSAVPSLRVLSANTDGVTFICRRNDKAHADASIANWETTTGFTTEETLYRSLHSRDVNNYIAIKTDGSAKLKGAYTPPNLQKNPANEICTEAVVAFLRDGTPLGNTICNCTDIRKFLTVRMVTGGAVKDGVYLGKTVRWYYDRSEEGTINYKTNGNIVPRSEGATPLMELPDALPPLLDYEWYLKEAQSILTDVGYYEEIA